MSNINTRTNDEIDLIELIKVLWDKKVWIILSAFVCTLIAGVYAFTAKEQWTSKAEFIAPRTLELGNYFHLRKEYARILNQPFDSNALQNNLFSDFNLFSESLDVRKSFFENSDYYKRLVDGKSEQEKGIILNELVTKKISVIKPDPKKEPDLLGRRMSFSAENAEDAQEILTQFITYLNNATFKLELDNFLLGVNEVIADLKFEKSKFENDLAIQKNVQLDNLNSALSIAKQAGIQEYVKSFGSSANNSAAQAIAMAETKIPLSDSKLRDGAYLFMLGEKYLNAQINVLEKNNLIYPPRYYEVSTLLSQLEPLLAKVNDVKLQAFSYQASPDYPVIKDKPKNVLILVIGLIFGLISACIFFLLRELIKYNEK